MFLMTPLAEYFELKYRIVAISKINTSHWFLQIPTVASKFTSDEALLNFIFLSIRKLP